MHQQGVEEIPIYRYWERLGGENCAMAYLASVDKTLQRQQDEDIFPKADLVSDLAGTANWTKIGVLLAEKILVAKNKLGHDHPDVDLRSITWVWLTTTSESTIGPSSTMRNH